MRGNLIIRVIAAAVIIGLTWFGRIMIGWSIQVPEADLPAWNIADLPKQLGDWKGEDVKLDAKLFEATGAASVVERQYRNIKTGIIVSIHLAIFKDANVGIWHNPISCYDSAGWVPVAWTKMPISEKNQNGDQLLLTTWEKSGERAIIGHWYQLGEYRLYERWDLGFNIRWKMRGLKTWPATIKVLLSADAGPTPDATKTQLVQFADLVHKWINQPEHQTKDEPAAAEPAAPK
jgi:hypothetical protein